MEDRKEGFYWVKSRRFGGTWEVAELDGYKLWYFCGCDEPQAYSFVTKIGLRIPTPEEQPTPEMIDAGAQRLVSWACDDLVWPDSWDALGVAAARNDADRVIRSALYASGDL